MDPVVRAEAVRKVYRNGATVEALAGVGLDVHAGELLPGFTAFENVGVPPLLTGARRREVRRRAMEMLDAVGLAHRADHRPNQLSGGGQQRVTVARALVHEPAVVWADEPTDNHGSGDGRADRRPARRGDRSRPHRRPDRPRRVAGGTGRPHVRMRGGLIEVADDTSAAVGSVIAEHLD